MPAQGSRSSLIRRRMRLPPRSSPSSNASTTRRPGAARSGGTRHRDRGNGFVRWALGDLPKLAQASGLAAHIEVERLPLSDAIRAAVPMARAIEWALSAGDDYELLLSVPPPRYHELEAAAAQLNLTLTAVGELRSGTV